MKVPDYDAHYALADFITDLFNEEPDHVLVTTVELIAATLRLATLNPTAAKALAEQFQKEHDGQCTIPDCIENRSRGLAARLAEWSIP